MNPLFANWRKRVRGYSRRPLHPVHGTWQQPATSDDPAAVWVSQAFAEAASGANGSGGPRAEAMDDAPAVIEFPKGRQARALEASPARPRGPLSWAYWSARKS